MKGSAPVLLMLLSAAIASAQSSMDVPKDPSVPGYLNLHKRHADGLEGPEDFDRFTTTEALSRLEQVRGFLKSFARLTDEVRPRLDEAALKAIGNTERSMQTLGFHNIPLIVEGTLLKQSYQLTQSRYELARLKYERGQMTAAEVAQARSAHESATRALQTFWDTRLPSD
jgi:hypothetical protein